MRYREETGRAKLQMRLMMMRKKLPRRSQRRGLTSFHTSGITFFSFGLGRFAVRSAVAALPTLREGRSAAFIPPPNLDGPKEEDIVYTDFTPVVSNSHAQSRLIGGEMHLEPPDISSF